MPRQRPSAHTRSLFDTHLDGQHRFGYLVRGPEWAFILPRGDLEALDDALRKCATLWNGAGTLLLSVDRETGVTAWDELLETRPVDDVWLHPALDHDLGAVARSRFPEAQPMHERFDSEEVHPVLLAPEVRPGDPKPSLLVPQAPSVELDRVRLALWGHLEEEDLPYWRDKFEVGQARGEAFLPALLSGQIEAPPTSPLTLGRSHMGVVSQGSPHDWPHLYLLPPEPGFDALVTFWNFRSRASVHVPGMPVVGIPREALHRPDQLKALKRWIAAGPDTQRTPDLVVTADQDARDQLDSALGDAGFECDGGGGKFRRSFGDRIVSRERPTYRHFHPLLGGPLVRGAHAWALGTFARGTGSLFLPQPDGLDLRGGHTVRVVIRDLPLPLPLIDPVARVVHRDAAAQDGVLLRLSTYADWYLDVRLPNRIEALHAWAAGHNCTAKATQDGRYAEALLGRLGTLDRLDALASPVAVSVLEHLAPTSRKKLAQRVAAELQGEHDIDEERLAERLRHEELHLELPSKAPGDLTGPDARLPAVLAALGLLADAGHTLRGRSLRCPTCNFQLWFPIDALAERVTCHACRTRFTLPVATTSGRCEPPLEFRLDGLTARAMDQDLLPVLLAMRALRTRFEGSWFSAWPGVEFACDGRRVDVDLLAHGPWVVCLEAKANAASLERSQLDALMGLCDRLGARPGIAALEGTFDTTLAHAVTERQGVVLQRADLLS